jgi:hypothetical protein
LVSPFCCRSMKDEVVKDLIDYLVTKKRLIEISFEIH